MTKTHPLIVPTLPPDELAGLLRDWQWLVQEKLTPFAITRMGDMLLRSPDGGIHVLDTGGCCIVRAADSLKDFESQLLDPERAAELLKADLFMDLLAGGSVLADGECFGFKVLPVLGGAWEPANYEPTDVQVHFGICGQVAKKVQDLPDGAVIDSVTFNDEDD